MSLVIRQATPADAATVARLNHLFNGVPADADAVAVRLQRCIATERIFLAEVDGLAVGFLSLWLFPIVCYAEPYAEISELYVSEGYRRHGIGAALMKEAIEVAKDEGAGELKVNTGFRNTAAQRLYTSLGFENLCLHLWMHLEHKSSNWLTIEPDHVDNEGK